MTSITSLTLDVPDEAAAAQFYADAIGLDGQLRFSAADAPTSGFRGYTVSLTVAQPANANALLDAAIATGAVVLKPAAKSMWGYGGVVQAPDGAIWKVATSAKKDSGPASREFDELIVLLGADDVAASKAFYIEHGIAVAKSFSRMYVQFDTPKYSIGFGLYGRKALAKDGGVPPAGTGSHRRTINSDAGDFSDPDGFAWASV